MPAGPVEELLARFHRLVEGYRVQAGVEQAYVEIELADGSRLALDSLSPEPGFGFVTLTPHPDPEDDSPDLVVVPVGSIRRIELRRAEEQRGRFGFAAPSA